MLQNAVPYGELVLRSVVVYFALLLGLRLFGKREIGQFTLFDLVLVLLVANAVQPAITGPDTSLMGGLIIIASLLLANFGVSMLDRVPAFHALLAGTPTDLVQDGEYLRPQMEREDVDEDEIQMAMREHGIDDLAQVKRAVLEPDGSISVIGVDEKVGPRRRRRRRFRRRI